MIARCLFVVCVSWQALGCGAAVQQKAIDKTLDTMTAEQRRGTFQDMAAVLDKHPDWVDEFYAVARAHDPLMRRFLTDATRDLKDPKLAATTGELLAAEPASLERVLIATVDAAKPNKEARLAIDRAVAERAEPMSDILTDNPATIDAVIGALLKVTAKKEGAREELRKSVDHHASRIVELAANDPALLSAMTRSILVAASKDKASLTKLLKELHIL
jgi:hypothetical protein